MATTAEQVFEMAMAVADEVPDSGLFTSSDLTSYKVRTPFLLTMLESELLREGEVFNTYSVTSEDEPFPSAAGDIEVVRITMPPDFKSVVQVNVTDTGGHYLNAPYQWEGRNVLLVSSSLEGTLTVIYRAAPSAVFALADTLHVDDITARTLLPYGLAAELFKMENQDIYDYASARYQELKRRAISPAQFAETTDCYRW